MVLLLSEGFCRLRCRGLALDEENLNLIRRKGGFLHQLSR